MKQYNIVFDIKCDIDILNVYFIIIFYLFYKITNENKFLFIKYSIFIAYINWLV